VKAFDHDKPADRDEWVCSINERVQETPARDRGEVRERFTRCRFNVCKEIEPAKVAQKWSKGIHQ